MFPEWLTVLSLSSWQLEVVGVTKSVVQLTTSLKGAALEVIALLECVVNGSHDRLAQALEQRSTRTRL